MALRFLNPFALRKTSTAAPGFSCAAVPDKERIYALGDVHGCSDLLHHLLDNILRDANGFDGRITLIGLGDYIDRGPDSCGVINLLQQIPPAWNRLFLRGNHEQAMLDFLNDPLRTEWLAWGGLEALKSYGITPFAARGLRSPDALAAELQFALDETGHRAFFDATRLSYTSGGYAFVHAGVRPRIPLEAQLASDLLFIREDFLGRPHHLPYKIVFGHTIFPDILFENDRIGLDTGAFQSGLLSAIALEGTDVRVLQSSFDNLKR